MLSNLSDSRLPIALSQRHETQTMGLNVSSAIGAAIVARFELIGDGLIHDACNQQEGSIM